MTIDRWGSGSSTSNAGCCTSCCKRSFDDDDFEREERKLRAEREAREARERDTAGEGASPTPTKPPSNGDHVVSTQPTGAKMMSDRPRSSQESARRDDALVKDET